MPTVKGKITQTTVHADDWNTIPSTGAGFFEIYMKELPQAPNGYQRVAVNSTHKAFAQIVQTALSAQSTKATVELTYLESHITRANSWDFGVLNVLS